MNYTECQLTLTPYHPFNEILMAELGNLGFESFVEEENDSLLKAYIPKDQFNLKLVEDCCKQFEELSAKFNVIDHEKVNWNQKWEESFDPIEVGTFCFIRAPFHSKDQRFEHEIIIEPKMSFGTGHHQTTQMMIELMEKVNFSDKTVLDMGSGTGILAILAKKMGANQVDAIDIEEWAYENMKENFQRNKVEVKGFHGDSDLLFKSDAKYDVIFANINKNILLADLSIYDRCLKKDGLIFFSGFYQTDEEDLLNTVQLQPYELIAKHHKDGWSAMKLKK